MSLLQRTKRCMAATKKIRIISQFVEAQRVGIGNLFSYFRGSEGKSYCLQS
jgi:hypothetical protein